jgi:hypothetical protein
MLDPKFHPDELGGFYEGNIENGCVSGFGKYSYPDGSIYTGY